MSDIEIIKKYGSIENYIYELEQEIKHLKEIMAEIVKYKELDSCSTVTQYMVKANVYKVYDTHIKKLKETNDKLYQQLDLYKEVIDKAIEYIETLNKIIPRFWFTKLLEILKKVK